jgi:hypothetical protein
MKKGRTIEVIFFGKHSVIGVVEDVGKIDATILIGTMGPGWYVRVPHAWIRQGEDPWLLELA